MTEPIERLKEKDWVVLLDRIKEKKCTPILGTGTRLEVLNLQSQIAEKWALDYHYPLDDSSNLARVARFVSVNYDADFTKQMLVKHLATLPAPNYKDPDNPYTILANLPLPVYITTSYDDFMFQALVLANKDVKRETCRWYKSIDEPRSIFDNGFDPTVANPVVFHFHGVTENLDSLVLTEDDYFEFLMSVSKVRLIPPRIEKAMTGSSLLLLGYNLTDWDFRVMFHLLASYLEIATSRTHVAVQIAPVGDQATADQKKRVQGYFDLYFEKYKKLDIRIYWGTCQEFLLELKERRK